MSQIATFNQIVGSETLHIAVPVSRLEKIIDRVDVLIENGNTFKARQILTPFIVADKPKKGKTAVTTSKVSKKGEALSLITKLQEYGRTRSQIIEQLQHDMELTYANARYYVVNVAKVVG